MNPATMRTLAPWPAVNLRSVTAMPHLVLALAEWSAVLAEFALFQRAANLSEKTISNRAEALGAIARITQHGPLDVMVEDLQRVLARPHPRTGERLAAGTMQSERSYMRVFFRWMKQTKRRKDNPAKELAKVKVPRRKARPLRSDQIVAMLESGIYQRTRDIIFIAAMTGLRLGEVVAIRGEDVDLVGMTVRSTRKGNMDHRIAFHPALIEIALRMPRKGWWFPSPHPNKQFPNGNGHILMKSASDRVGKAIRKAGVTDARITGHSLRHFCATALLREGVPVRVVQEILGHASLATTQLYAEVTDEDQQLAIVRLPAPTMPEQSGRKRTTESGRLAA